MVRIRWKDKSLLSSRSTHVHSVRAGYSLLLVVNSGGRRLRNVGNSCGGGASLTG
jgi:hypothetical protein